MIHWIKEAPEPEIDYNKYKPFIGNDFLRKNYMWFAYGLMGILFVLACVCGTMRAGNFLIRVGIFALVYPIHEFLHILVAYRKGDIYLTHSGLYFWLTPNVQMRKWVFWTFITLPFLMLTVVPGIVSLFCVEEVRSYLVYIAWINAIIAGSDIINSILILLKPNGSAFYRGYWCLEDNG